MRRLLFVVIALAALPVAARVEQVGGNDEFCYRFNPGNVVRMSNAWGYEVRVPCTPDLVTSGDCTQEQLDNGDDINNPESRADFVDGKILKVITDQDAKFRRIQRVRESRETDPDPPITELPGGGGPP